MENVIKQCVGIDCAKNELVCCFAVFTGNLEVLVKSNQIFENTATGINKLIAWAEKIKADQELYYAVEATGVYHELLAYTLAGERKSALFFPERHICTWRRST